MLNIAIIGPGRIADRFLAPAIEQTPGLQLWSVLSRDLSRAKDFAQKHKAKAPTAYYDSLEQLLADEQLHAVLIATTDPTHADIAIKAANAKKHIFCEKPLCTTEAEGQAMLVACQQNKVKLGVAYHLRWHDGHRLLWQKVQQGALGELRHMRIQWTYQTADGSNWRARPDSGRWWSLAGVGTHCLDLVRWFLRPTCGEVIEEKCIFTQSVFQQGNDETAIVSLRFASGATAEITTSVLFDSEAIFEVYGTKGSASCEQTLGPHGAGQIKLLGEALSFEVKNPYIGELTDFVACIKEGRSPEVSGEEGLRNVEMLLRAVPR
jgi:predicted dehydrogenase